MSEIILGNNFKLYYNEDVGNSVPQSPGNILINELAEFPTLTISSKAESFETYDSEYLSRLLAEQTVDPFDIVVNYVPDDPTHQFLDDAAINQQQFQILMVYDYEDGDENIAYAIVNGSISAYRISGDKDEVVRKTYTFVHSQVMTRSTVAKANLPLYVGNFGVGSDGINTPQYQPENPGGNSFIKVPASAVGNPSSTDLLGVGLTDNGSVVEIAATKSGTLSLFAKNASTAWTRIYTASQIDSRYVPLTRTVNGKDLGTDITLNSTDVGALDLSGGTLTADLNGTNILMSGDVVSASVATTTINAKDVIASGDVSSSNLTVANTISTDDLTVAGDVKVAGDVSASDATFTGKVQAESLNADSITTGSLESSTGKFTGKIEAADAAFTGAIQAADAAFTGKVQAGALELDTPLPVSSGGTGSTEADGSGAYNISALPMRPEVTSQVDINNFGPNAAYVGIWKFNSTEAVTSTNLPVAEHGILEVLDAGINGGMQRYTTGGHIYVRTLSSAWDESEPQWGSWLSVGLNASREVLTSLDTTFNAGMYSTDDSTVGIPAAGVGECVVYDHADGNHVTQVYHTSTNREFIRAGYDGVWSDWAEVVTTDNIQDTVISKYIDPFGLGKSVSVSDLNNVNGSGFYHFAAESENTPSENDGTLLHNQYADGSASQFAVISGNRLYSRVRYDGVWSDWAEYVNADTVIPVEKGGTGNTTGNAKSADKLSSTHTLITDLSSTEEATFDGTNDVVQGVKGILPIEHGGSGADNAPDARTNLSAAKSGINSDITSLKSLSGPLRLGGDAASDYDAVTLKQLLANAGGGSGPTLNGVMNNYLGQVSWFNGTRAKLPTASLGSDGQILNRADYPDLWNAINSGMFNSVSDELWLDSGISTNPSANRGMYSTGDGVSTFRMPDLNGSQEGSTPNLYLRGTGTGVSGIPSGTTSDSALPNISGGFNIRRVFTGSTETDSIIATGGVFSKTVQPSSSVWNRFQQSTNSGNNVDVMAFDASKANPIYGRDGVGEARPRSAWGIWVIRVSGVFEAANTTFNVYNADKTKPENGVITYGGSLNSVYQIGGADYSVTRLRAKVNIGDGQEHAAVLNFGNPSNPSSVTFGQGTDTVVMSVEKQLDLYSGGGSYMRLRNDGSIRLQSTNVGAFIELSNLGISTGSKIDINASDGAFIRHNQTTKGGTSYVLSLINDQPNWYIGKPNLDNNNNVYWYSYVLGTQLQLQSDRIYANKFINAPAFTPTSDERIKTNKIPLTEALSKVVQLQGYESYTLTFSDDYKFETGGLLAQDVQKVMPVAVKGGGGEGLDENGNVVQDLLSLDYNALSALFVESIKEMKIMIDELQNELNELKNK
ncbi:MAG: hypothetical protein K0S95_749 [Pantoea eucrina]|jgi:cytoskeletal protein CcmA (bactofilin family)|nr:hypothetical protein [Pantoea eucrina]